MQQRIQVLTTSDLAPLVGRDDTQVRRYISAGADGGLAMLGAGGRYFVHPNDAAEIAARLRALPGRRNRSTSRPRVA